MRQIPSTGETLPVIGIGTWQTFDVGDNADARESLGAVLEGFVEMGGTMVDSSPMYKSSEEVIGAITGARGLRNKLFMASKVWTTGRLEGIAQMADSLRKMKADPIDLMQVHNLVDCATHLATLREWKSRGRVRYIGITHYRAEAHDAVIDVLAKEKVDFVQINYSAIEPEAAGRLLPLAADRGVAVIVNRPFGGGNLLRSLVGRPLPSWAGDIACENWAQVLLKFVLSHPAVTCAIPGTSRLAHLRDNMMAGSGVVPDSAIRERITAAIAAV